MIRSATSEDTPEILETWLQASLLAHPFISSCFWRSRLNDMEQIYLPQAETYVCEQYDEVVGFISLVENHLAALFVIPMLQGHGHGKRLLQHAQSIRNELSLCVYSRNTRALTFYRRSGFREQHERRDCHTGEFERLMIWIREPEHILPE
jgi:putative acetyltransferase